MGEKNHQIKAAKTHFTFLLIVSINHVENNEQNKSKKVCIVPLNTLLQVPCLHFTVRTTKSLFACMQTESIQKTEPFFLLCLPPETSDGRVPLPGAAGEQQLQHLPLQEVPQHVCGAEADWPVQVWEQNWTGSEGHPVSPDVHRELKAAPGGGRETPRCDGNEDGAVRKSLPPENNCDAFTTDSSWYFILLQPCSASALASSTNSGPTSHRPDAIVAPLMVSKGHLWHRRRWGDSFCGSVTEISQKHNRRGRRGSEEETDSCLFKVLLKWSQTKCTTNKMKHRNSWGVSRRTRRDGVLRFLAVDRVDPSTSTSVTSTDSCCHNPESHEESNKPQTNNVRSFKDCTLI